jgi:ABC-type Fe3+-hydroxamate transport system substrate-binding protein
VQRTVRDHLDRIVQMPCPPRRIVSLCPSLTETLFDLGAGPAVVGRTRYCVHPAEHVDIVPVVGGVQDVDTDAVTALHPDLVIATKEENLAVDVETIAKSTPVFVVSVHDTASALRAIHDLGDLTGHAHNTRRRIDAIETAFAHLSSGPLGTAVCLVWKSPWTSVGRDTYIHSLMELCGWHNLTADLPGRYPNVTLGTLMALAPEYVLLPSEPHRFSDSDASALAASLPRTRVLCLDGQMLTWYGSRMYFAAAYLRDLTASLRGVAE